MRNPFLLCSLAIVALAFFGCRSAALHDYTDNPIPAVTGTLTKQDVEVAIKKAGIVYGWEMRNVADGQIEATLHVRAHTAVVDIFYTTTNYSVKYKSSENLDYNGHDIHSQYYVWLNNLRKQINQEISAIALTKNPNSSTTGNPTR